MAIKKSDVGSGDNEYQKGYGAGYAAGKRFVVEHVPVVNHEKIETYNRIVNQLASMYFTNGYGVEVNGKFTKYNPEQCLKEAIRQANDLITRVSIK